MAFSVPSLTTLISRVKGDINSRLGNQSAFLSRSVAWAFSYAHAGTAWGLYRYQSWIAKQATPLHADAETLADWARIWEVTLNPATKASGTVEVSGISGGAVPDGTVLTYDDGTEYITTNGPYAWTTTEAQTVAVTASVAGIDGNIDYATNADLSFASPPTGIVATAGLTADVDIDGGADVETTEAMRARLLFILQNPPQGGAEADYEAWVRDVDGLSVDGVWVIPPVEHGGAQNVVKILFTLEGTEDDVIPTASNAATVSTALGVSTIKPVTVVLDVDPPTQLEPALSITLVIEDGATPATVQAAIVTELASMYADQATVSASATTIANSRFLEAIGNAEGVDTFALTAVNGGAATADLSIAAYEYPTVQDADIDWS